VVVAVLPLLTDQLKTEDWPAVIVKGLAVKKLITGAEPPPELTVTVTAAVDVPFSLAAVKV
jgi:hypothetical protein